MNKSFVLPTAVLALGLAFTATANAGVSGTLGASYASDTDSGAGDLWNINGSLTGLVSSNWGLEATGGYHSLSGGGSSLDIWNIGGSAFWAGMQGRLAATVNYYSTSSSGIDLNVTSYGVGGEFYAGPNFTVAVKGGGNTISAFGSDDSGGYAGGMLKWYAIPNLAISGAVDYTEFSGVHVTAESVQLEWMFSNDVPLSIYGGYQHEDISAGFFGGGNGNTFNVGLKFYFNNPTGGSLVDRQRSGSLGYIADASVLGLPTH
ncbi:MAG TPA: hypothetical protein VHE09_05310 [Rhizomicrobium sp.]|jgi:hypothetical protein|nr:hypothetical protein [Rhizomicrobium sp.]